MNPDDGGVTLTMYDFGIEDAVLVLPTGTKRANLYVAGGRIAAVGPRRHEAREQVDAGGRALLPGMVDTHVHLMDPGEPEREDFPSGTAAAASSGVTTVLEHTHARPVRTAVDLEQKRVELEGRSWVDYGLVAHAWPGMCDEAAGVWRAGAAYLKLFTCETHGVAAHDAPSVLQHFTAYAQIGAVCLVHCEDDALTATAEDELRDAGRSDGSLVAEWRSPLAEEVAVAEILQIARRTGARVGIAHCSSPSVVALITQARTAGANAVGEACLQYFLLREAELGEQGTLRKFTPPVRVRDDADEDEMWRLLRSGELAFVSSDHAPSTRAQKALGIWDAPFGLPGLDTTAALLLDAAACGRLSLPEVVRVYAEEPARHYGLWPRKGSLEIGADADLVLVDLDAERLLSDEHVQSKAGWTPYAGRRVRGAVVATWLRGKPVVRNGNLLGQPEGRFVPGAGAVWPRDGDER